MRTLTVVLSSILLLALSELFMSLYLPNSYYVWPPNFTRTFRPQPDVIHGIASPSLLTINSIGLRGDPLSGHEKYQLLAVGGSTTICVYMDDLKAWPYLLQERLNQTLGPKSTWVGNAGRPGHSTPNHVMQVEKLLEQHPEIDAVVLLVGINDLLVSLSATIDRPPVFREGPNAALRRTFAVFPDWDEDAPWYARNVIGRLARLRDWHPLPSKLDGVLSMDEKGDFVRGLRTYRKAASSFRETLPDISAALAVYSRNLDAIVDRVERAGRRAIFVTQPTLWKREMPQSELDLIWGGGTDLFHLKRGKPYYSTGALTEAMALYNDALLEMCQKRGVECVDLARVVPRTTEVFYDDAHFTEHGSAIVADYLAGYLLDREPLDQLR